MAVHNETGRAPLIEIDLLYIENARIMDSN